MNLCSPRPSGLQASKSRIINLILLDPFINAQFCGLQSQSHVDGTRPMFLACLIYPPAKHIFLTSHQLMWVFNGIIV